MNAARCATFAVLAFSALLAGNAAATVTNATANPNSTSIPAATSSTVVLTWQATTVPDASGAGGGGALVQSTEGVFRANGPTGTVIGTNSLLIDAVAQGPAGQPGTATFAETVTVPLAVLTQAARLGATRIIYQRAFSDGPFQPVGGNVAEVTMTLAFSLSVDVTPPATSITSGLASSISVAWQTSGGAAGTTVSSPEGLFRAGGPAGQVIGRNSQALSAPVLAIGGTTGALLPETVPVPSIVVMRAEQLGVARIAYERSFTAPGAQAGSDSALFEFVGAQGGPFRITGIALRFADGSRQAVVTTADRPVAFADITYVGTGRFEAQWEIAEPATTRGSPVFRPLELVRRQLVGSTRSTIRSPDLPANVEGVYLLRLRIDGPTPGIEQPVLRYVVNPADPLPAPRPMTITAPAPGAVHSASTRFAWQALDGAATYRVEFHELSADATMASADAESPGDAPTAGAPSSGIAVDGTVTDTGLSRLALSHLAPGRFYRWRVVAWDESGRPVGRSEFRRLYLPGPDDGN